MSPESRQSNRRSLSFRARRAIGLTLVALTLVTASCGDDGDDEPRSTGREATPGSNTVGATGEGPGPFQWRGEPERDGSLAAAQVVAQQVATMAEPTVMVARPGDNRLYVGERGGTVRMLAPAGDQLRPLPAVVLDISEDVTTGSEQGLLGLAFSLDGTRLYVSHTNIDGDSRLVEYTMRPDGTADPASARVLLAQTQPYPNHNGGGVAVGPDGLLYLGLGDGGSRDDPENRAQNPDELLGKILRIDPTRPSDGRPYSIPDDNPYRNGGGRAEIFISGARNPWRFSFDQATGDLWIGDVGQNAVEEIDLLPRGTASGKNLGWSGFEGSVSYLNGEGRRPDRSVPPVFEYRHDGGNCSVTGGYVYRGRAIPALAGAYLFADYCAGQLRALRLGPDGTVADERLLGVELSQPASFAQDNASELYVVSQEGGIFRLTAGGR